ncbi:nitrite reductase [Anopheles sinensis]|uniref:Nitrite reductase n=1 Tax=Anopheles sinensis TaxID=74873 RepID=A0A084VSA6_ANOSI|nr:nitrite reductase [Anopheles sinensis]
MEEFHRRIKKRPGGGAWFRFGLTILFSAMLTKLDDRSRTPGAAQKECIRGSLPTLAPTAGWQATAQISCLTAPQTSGAKIVRPIDSPGKPTRDEILGRTRTTDANRMSERNAIQRSIRCEWRKSLFPPLQPMLLSSSSVERFYLAFGFGRFAKGELFFGSTNGKQGPGRTELGWEKTSNRSCARMCSRVQQPARREPGKVQ